MAHEPPVSHAYRRERLARVLPADVDVLLVTSAPNVRYLSGFSGSNGALIVGRDGHGILATDSRYLIQAGAQAPDVDTIEARAVGPALVEWAVRERAARIGFEPHAITVSALHGLREAAAGAQLVETNGLVEQLRSVKDASELRNLATACRITDQAFEEVVLRLRAGVTEREVAWALTEAMRRNGAEADAFPAIVAFGPNSAIPHHEPGDRELMPGDLVKTDFGARFAGYHADLTRTVVHGPAAEWQRELHEVVAGIQSARRFEAVAGAVPADLDARARADIEASGRSAGHGLGHGVGLQIHEDPFLTPASAAGPLQVDTVVTIEPGIYLEGRGGVRIEDTVAITEGAPTCLTNASRDLIEV